MNETPGVNIQQLREQIEYAKKLKQAQDELLTCVDKNCKKVAVNYNTILENTKTQFKTLLEKYRTNKINEKKLLLSIINILKKNLNDLKYTNYMKCLIKNCYKNYKLYIDLIYSSLSNDFIQKFILVKAKEFKLEKDVKRFMRLIKDQSTMKKIKLTANLLVTILEKLYKNNEAFIIKMIKENKVNIPIIISQIK